MVAISDCPSMQHAAVVLSGAREVKYFVKWMTGAKSKDPGTAYTAILRQGVRTKQREAASGPNWLHLRAGVGDGKESIGCAKKQKFYRKNIYNCLAYSTLENLSKERSNMASPTSKLKATPPKNILIKPLTADFKALFTALTKGISHAAIGKWEELGNDAVEGLSAIGLATEPSELELQRESPQWVKL